MGLIDEDEGHDDIPDLGGDLTCTSDVTGVSTLDLANLQPNQDIPVDSESATVQMPPISGRVSKRHTAGGGICRSECCLLL
jgi:hypothetical protein